MIHPDPMAGLRIVCLNSTISMPGGLRRVRCVLGR